ncbi:PHD finger protein 14 [Holothuria leucospilota]|uniref:PHD finger protein 14 n=1 Tax=Holothuria leucospilota TaxID=206669 RepID=A0A9Q1C1N3_HOLLE|nr:PHD finger protein 14 [Holothuria leucospilota]
MSQENENPGSSKRQKRVAPAIDYEQEQVQFLFRALYERDPKKRKVKPVERHLLQVDFGLSDSENDSDFEIQEHDEEESDEEKVYDSDGDEYGEEEEGSDAATEETSESEVGSKDVTVGQLIAKAKAQQIKDRNTSTGSTAERKPADNLRFLICSVCLGEVSEDTDEIIECDNCGIAVHEGCYGENLADNESVSSVQTDSSTEPWFCDACKAGVTNPSCELCPNLGGIFKETDAGRWVHIVCALYIPGVAFGDVEKLRWVTLSEMNPTKWGAKECCYCEEECFGRTGVCIGCDAGMCKNYFHVTCGQRMGLLSEVSPEVHIADPFYAYCKLHVDKSIMRYKRQNFLAVQSHQKANAKKELVETPTTQRIMTKLEKSRSRYADAKSKRPGPWVPTEKVPRALTTSASACRKLMRKAELMGIVSNVSGTSPGNVNEAKRKWHVQPAFTPEFVNYFLDRDIRLTNYKSQLADLIKHSEKLNKEEQGLRNFYNQLSSELDTLRVQNPKMKQDAENYWRMLRDLSGKKLPLPSVLRPTKVKKSPPKKSEVKSPTIIHLCGICKNTHDQHLLLQCDTCKKHYHLGCLDPPLTRMPKKTAFAGWQCSQCVGSSSDDEVRPLPDEGDDGIKRVKRAIKEPSKYTPMVIQSRKLVKGKKKKKQRPKKEVIDEKLPQKVPKIVKSPRVKREEHVNPPMPRTVMSRTSIPEEEPTDKLCNICDLSGTLKTLVSCDECEKCYHFGCLDPPYKKNPKVRGYGWYCPECISSGEEDDD